ncbi:hypothetical protein PRK78_001203 [Emydomyces testavorans]|uniref:Zn(2)-C6 fungal-type domain-containing protein n=1 Tax=Emydomyces testavorans TaxID=2070801 RepID=A0AAF0DCI5_9EURO|nr:hypothetical protein PRK78_001203 [Emydomyces testavorans]
MASAYPDLDTPLLKVSRPVAACSRCRNAKIKCDGKLPACSACERAGRSGSCSGATDEFAKGKERSYVASLEAQCERLEKKIEAARRHHEGITGHIDAETGGVNATATTTTSASAGDPSYGKESCDIDDLVGDFGFLAVNATSRDFYGIRSSTSFAGLLLRVAIAEPLPRSIGRIELPPHSQIGSLTLHYFDYFHPSIPFLSETKFWTSVDAIYQDNGRFANSHDHWTLRMVLAISAASKSRGMNDRDSQIAMYHAHVALGYSEEVLQPGTIAGIQAILLLALYSMLNPKYFRTWYLIGIAARVTTDLGIHQEHASASLLDKALLDSRRRTFHCVYSLDRYVSTALGRALSFSDDSINVPFPTDPPLSASVRTWQSELFLRSIEPALFLFQIRHFQSAAYQDMFFGGRQTCSMAQSYVWERCTAATTWFQSCPKDPPAQFSTLFHLEYLYTIIMVLSPSNRSPTISKTNQRHLFENSINFVTQVYSEVTSHTGFTSLLTYMDIERTYTVACKLVNLLRQNHNEVLQDETAEQTELPQLSPDGDSAPAPLGVIATGRHSRTRRALVCLYNAHSVFEYALRRWNVRTLLDDFERSSVDLKAILSSRLGQQQSYYPPARGTAGQSRSPEFEHGHGYGHSQPPPETHVQHLFQVPQTQQPHGRSLRKDQPDAALEFCNLLDHHQMLSVELPDLKTISFTSTFRELDSRRVIPSLRSHYTSERDALAIDLDSLNDGFNPMLLSDLFSARSIGTKPSPREDKRSSQISQPDPEIETHNHEEIAELFPTTSLEQLKDDNIKPYSDASPIYKHRLLRSEQFRRLIGDLETCGTDLLPYASEDVLAGSSLVTRSSIRSCREAIFTFLRWAKGDSAYLNLSTVNQAQLRKNGLDGQCDCASSHNSIDPHPTASNTTCEFEDSGWNWTSRRIIDIMEHPPVLSHTPSKRSSKVPKADTAETLDMPHTPQLLACEENVCRIGDLSRICTKPKSRMTTGEIDVCKMCYPRDEKRLQAYCVVREQREHRAFYVAAGMLASFSIVLAGLILYRDCLEKRAAKSFDNAREGERETDQASQASRSIAMQNWVSQMFRYFKSHVKMSGDVEKFQPNTAAADKEGMFARGLNEEDDGSSIKSELYSAPTVRRIEKKTVTRVRRTGAPEDGVAVGTVPIMPRARTRNARIQHSVPITPTSWMLQRENVDALIYQSSGPEDGNE